MQFSAAVNQEIFSELEHADDTTFSTIQLGDLESVEIPTPVLNTNVSVKTSNASAKYQRQC